ncbi:hypothetical protein GCM10023149_22840 [Mucilaginibacter gynuensis]|uniref:Uncharacterized protein n=1 Tax=Mucilaginibacter gynuensis TaxID=1302236 RepID=A0ABP8GDT6_9SPHI
MRLKPGKFLLLIVFLSIASIACAIPLRAVINLKADAYRQAILNPQSDQELDVQIICPLSNSIHRVTEPFVLLVPVGTPSLKVYPVSVDVKINLTDTYIRSANRLMLYPFHGFW